MTNASNIKNRIKWKHLSKDIIKVIEKISLQMWINRVNKYLVESEKSGRLPTLAGFYKEWGMWIYYLREDIAKGNYSKREDLQRKYDIIKRIIQTGKVENIENLNKSTATFAIELLRNEQVWTQQEVKAPQQITFNISSFALPAVPHSDIPIIDSQPLDNLTLLTDCIAPPSTTPPGTAPGAGTGDESDDSCAGAEGDSDENNKEGSNQDIESSVCEGSAVGEVQTYLPVESENSNVHPKIFKPEILEDDFDTLPIKEKED